MIDLGRLCAGIFVRISTGQEQPSVQERVTSAAVILIVLSSLASGQNIVGVVHNSPAPPRPEEPILQVPYLFVEGDLNVNGDGYQALSPDVRAGIDIEGRHLSLTIGAAYDFVRKTNDNAQVPNEKGRVREADAELLYKFHPGSSWFVVAGAGWGETSLTPYMKSSWSPRVGGGHDFVNEFNSWRLQFSYLHAMNEVVRYPTLVIFTPGPGQASPSYTCSLCGNDVQAISASVQYPSPSSSAHWFVLISLQTDWFHETVTDPYNLSMTPGQKSQISASGHYSAGLIYRFKPLHFRRTR